MQAVRRIVAVFSLSAAAWAQPTAFEVASIKASPPPTGNPMRAGMSGGPGTTSPGRITCESMPLTTLVQRAYNLKPYQVAMPEWMSSARFDIVVKVPDQATKEQVLMMWQNLLAERFKLAVHRETRDMPIYALTVDKGGPKLTEASPDDPAKPNNPGRSGYSVSPGSMHIYADKMTIANMAATLTTSMDRPVIDQTGLTGQYKINLEFQREDLSANAPEGAAGPTIFAAVQEQLGLKLEPRKAAIEMLVVDRAERNPTEN